MVAGYDITKLKSGFSRLGIGSDEEKLDRLVRFYELMIEKNKVMNLTAIVEWGEVVDKHFIDSASVVDVIISDGRRVYDLLKKGINVCDVGTGAGFPGIPLAILFPESRFCLMDALKKRIDFLNEVVMDICLENVSLIHGRAEDLASDGSFRESFDICVSRAVSSLNVLSEYCLPFVKVGGTFLSYKGEKGLIEAKEASFAIGKLGGGSPVVHDISIPDSDLNRLMIEIPKVSSTDKKYPRRAGIPDKKPLSS